MDSCTGHEVHRSPVSPWNDTEKISIAQAQMSRMPCTNRQMFNARTVARTSVVKRGAFRSASILEMVAEPGAKA